MPHNAIKKCLIIEKNQAIIDCCIAFLYLFALVLFCLCTFTLFHLCTFAPLCICSIIVYKPVTNHLYANIILEYIFSSYIIPIDHLIQLRFDIFLLMWSFVFCLSCSYDLLHRLLPLATLASSSALLLAYFTLGNMRPFNWINFF